MPVEVLADRLKVGLTSLAVGAATSGQGNPNSDVASLNNTGLLGQIDQADQTLESIRTAITRLAK